MTVLEKEWKPSDSEKITKEAFQADTSGFIIFIVNIIDINIVDIVIRHKTLGFYGWIQ